MGTLAGDLVYMLIAVSGLAVLMTANAALFSLVRWAGIAYLCRLGWKLLRSTGDGAAAHAMAPPSAGRSFRQAFAVGLTNPKAVIFFMVFFPLFMSADSKPATLAVMMVNVTLVCLLYQSALVLVGDRISRRVAGGERMRAIAGRLAGAALLGFGVKLAFDNR